MVRARREVDLNWLGGIDLRDGGTMFYEERGNRECWKRAEGKMGWKAEKSRTS